jgi:hypothetical protein
MSEIFDMQWGLVKATHQSLHNGYVHAMFSIGETRCASD